MELLLRSEYLSNMAFDYLYSFYEYNKNNK